MKNNNKKGFTLAEVLITLIIIGVVAALTIPSLLANVSDRTYEAKRKGLATRMAQAIAQIGTITAYEATPPEGNTEANYAEKYSSMNFVVEALSKVYRISAICEYNQFAACDFPTVIVRPTDSNPYYINNFYRISNYDAYYTTTGKGGLNSYSVLFKTKNNESIALFYNPKCVAEQDVDPATGEKAYGNEICVSMIYDLDGAKKGPNTLGKDIGSMAVLYADQPYFVAPNPPNFQLRGEANKTLYKGTEATKNCANWAAQYRQQGDWTLPSKEELYAVSAAYYIYLGIGDTYVWSASVEGTTEEDYGWAVRPREMTAKKVPLSEKYSIVCKASEWH